jgi:hypothetical protein
MLQFKKFLVLSLSVKICIHSDLFKICTSTDGTERIETDD